MQGSLMREEINAAGLKIKQVAQKMSVTESRLYKLLRGQVSEKNIERIRDAIKELGKTAVPRIRRDCAFFQTTNNGGKCIGLKELVCKKEICPFFKTFEQERDELYKTGMNCKGRSKK